MYKHLTSKNLMPCAICNAKAKLEEDWDFRDTYQGRCSNAHKCGNGMVGYNIERNRAVHKWNNKQILLKKMMNDENIEIKLKNGKPTAFMFRLFNIVERAKSKEQK